MQLVRGGEEREATVRELRRIAQGLADAEGRSYLVMTRRDPGERASQYELAFCVAAEDATAWQRANCEGAPLDPTRRG